MNRTVITIIATVALAMSLATYAWACPWQVVASSETTNGQCNNYPTPCGITGPCEYCTPDTATNGTCTDVGSGGNSLTGVCHAANYNSAYNVAQANWGYDCESGDACVGNNATYNYAAGTPCGG